MTIRRQQTYDIFFNAFGDIALIANLNRMFYQGKGNILQQCFSLLANLQKNNYEQYLFMDCDPRSNFPKSMRLRTNIFDINEPYFFMTDD